MINLTLSIRGFKPKTYQADIRMRECLQAFVLADKWDKAGGNYDDMLIDDALAFIVRCFGKQFTVDDLMDGYEGSPYALIPTFLRAVIGYVAEELVDFPPKAATATAGKKAG
jgi:hypothetical protein